MQEVQKKKLRLLLLIAIFLSSLYICSTVEKSLIDYSHTSVEDNPKYSGSTPLWEYINGDNILEVAISSDSNYIIAGTSNNRVRLFHKSSSVPLWSFAAGDKVLSVDISSNGEYCVASGYDRFVRLFDNTSSTPLWSFGTPGGSWMSETAISSDGNYIVAGSASLYNTIYLFHKSSSTPLWRYDISDWVESVAISSDGSYIVVGSRDNKIRLFHRSSSTPLWSFTTLSRVSKVDISASGDYIVAGTEGWGIIHFFNRSSSTPKWSYQTYRDISTVAISSDGEYVVSGGIDDYIRFFHRSSSTQLWTYKAIWDISSVAISSNGKFITAGTYTPDRKVYLFEKSSNIPLWNFTAFDRVYSVDISSDGKYIVAGSWDNYLRLFYESFEPLSFTLTSNAENPDTDGSFDLNWTESRLSNNYSIYVSDDYITEINSSLTLLNDGLKSLSHPISVMTNGTYYYIVVAFNQYGNVTTNCISVEVKLFPPDDFILSTDADTPDIDGSFNLIWTNSMYADIYSVYGYDRYITEINNSLTILANQNAVSPYLISGLSNGTYYYKIVSFNEFGNASSNCISIEVKLYPPGLFTLTTDADTPDIDGSFSLIWTNSIGANNYSVYDYDRYITEINSSLTILANQTATSPYLISGLSNGTYYYIIKAYNATGSRLSNCISVEVKLFPPDDFILSTDADTPDIDGSFNLIWTNSMYADIYSVYGYDRYITEINNSLTILANQNAVSPYLISGLSNGTYYYKIVSFNEFGNASSNCISIEVKLYPPGSFTLTTDADTPDTDGSFSLIWTNSAGADNYSVYLFDRYITQINNSLTILANQTAVSPYFITLNSGIHYFLVIVYNKTGFTLSNCVSVNIQIPPSAFTLTTDAETPDTDGSFSLIWTNSAGADNYSVYLFDRYITQINNSLTLLTDQTAGSPFPINENSGIYYFIIVAINEYGMIISNCIEIEVNLPSDQSNIILGYNLIFLIGAVSLVLVLVIRKLQKPSKKLSINFLYLN